MRDGELEWEHGNAELGKGTWEWEQGFGNENRESRAAFLIVAVRLLRNYAELRGKQRGAACPAKKKAPTFFATFGRCR